MAMNKMKTGFTSLTAGITASVAAAIMALPALGWEMGDPIVTYWAGPGYPGSSMPISDASLKQLKDCGFNLVWASSRKDLDLIAKWGLRAICHLGIACGKNLDPDNCDGFRRRIEGLKDHPALYIYHHCDEPSVGWFKGLAADSRIARSIDPKHPTWVNLLPSSPS